VELMGTCHSEVQKAAVLKPVHIQRYQLHVERGLSFDPPEVQLLTVLLTYLLTADDVDDDATISYTPTVAKFVLPAHAKATLSALCAMLLIYSFQFLSAFLPRRSASQAAQRRTWFTQYRISDVAENLGRFLVWSV